MWIAYLFISLGAMPCILPSVRVTAYLDTRTLWLVGWREGHPFLLYLSL